MGNLLAQETYGANYQLGALAYGADTLFSTYTVNSTTHGVAFLLPSTMGFDGSFFESVDPINRLTFGDDHLFTSDIFGLGKYDLDAHQVAYKTTPLIEFDALTYMPQSRPTRPVDPRNPLDPRIPSGAVPEPSTWAMLILGFGAIGTVTRFRRQERLSPT